MFVTATYTFRMVFMAFHGAERFDKHHPPHESPPVVTVPLVLLAIPSIVAGYVIGEVVFGNYFGNSLPPPDPNYYGIWSFILHGFVSLPFWLALAGIATAWHPVSERDRTCPSASPRSFGPLYALVERKYGFDELYSVALRRRRAQPRQGLLARRRPDADRRPDGERLGARGGLVLGRGAPVPDAASSTSTRSAC